MEERQAMVGHSNETSSEDPVNLDIDSIKLEVEDEDDVMEAFANELSNNDDDDDDDDEDNDDDDDVVIIDAEKTMQYLSGQISFGEYSAVLEVHAPKATASLTSANKLVPMVPDIGPGSGKTGRDFHDRPVKRRQRNRLSIDLRGLMGEANIKTARGELDEAVLLCKEIIRRASNVPDPFQTLANIYELKGDIEKQLEYELIVAHLKRGDAEHWFTLGQEFHRIKNVEQALYCFKRGYRSVRTPNPAVRTDVIEDDTAICSLIGTLFVVVTAAAMAKRNSYNGGVTSQQTFATRLEPTVIDYWLAMRDLLIQQGDVKGEMDCYQRMITYLPADSKLYYMELARKLTVWYNDLGEVDKALSVMSTALDQHPDVFTTTDTNHLVELYFKKCVYDKPLLVLIRHCGASLCYAEEPFAISKAQCPLSGLPSQKPVRCDVAEDMPIDLKAKLIISLIRLGHQACCQSIVDEVSCENPDEVGDLHLDIAEAYMSMSVFSAAKPLLFNLVSSVEYNKPMVWLRYAECLAALQDVSSAVAAYENVVTLVPTHFEACVSLSALYQQLGRTDDAIRVLLHQSVAGVESNEDEEFDVRLLLPCCTLLYNQQRYDEFIVCSKQLLFGLCRGIYEKRTLEAIVNSRVMKGRYSALRYAEGLQFFNQFRAAAKLDSSTVSTDDLWDLYLKLCGLLIDLKKFDLFERVSILALICPQFLHDSVKAYEANFVCLTACVMNHNGHFAYNFAREFCVKNLSSNKAWNLFCQIISMSQDIRHNRFCLRMAMKHPESHALGILNGHNAMLSGSYKYALGEYMASLRNTPNDPLVNLLIGIAFVHLACQRFTSSRHALVTQGCAFLNQYRQLRGDCQESFYNLGRAMQQLGLYHAAIYYYQKGLECPVPVTDDDADLFDLRRDLAFNLRLIYESSGSHDLACLLTQQHLVV